MSDDARDEHMEVAKFYVPIQKAAEEERTVTGIVLRPDVVDAQGDIMDSAVIRKAAYEFLANFNKKTNLGYMHKDMNPKFELVESYIAPCELNINGSTVTKGSWVMTMKVLDDKAWKMVKGGKLTGFSIGGKAKVQSLQADKPKTAS